MVLKDLSEALRTGTLSRRELFELAKDFGKGLTGLYVASKLTGCGGDDDNSITGNNIKDKLPDGQYKLRGGAIAEVKYNPPDNNGLATVNVRFDGEELIGSYMQPPLPTSVVAPGFKYDITGLNNSPDGFVAREDLELAIKNSLDAKGVLNLTKDEFRAMLSDLGKWSAVVDGLKVSSGLDFGSAILEVPDLSKVTGIDRVLVRYSGDGVNGEKTFAPNAQGLYVVQNDLLNGALADFSAEIFGKYGNEFLVQAKSVRERVAMQYANVDLTRMTKDSNGLYVPPPLVIPVLPAKVWAYGVVEDREDAIYRFVFNNGDYAGGRDSKFIPIVYHDGKIRVNRIELTKDAKQGENHLVIAEQIGKLYRIVFTDNENLSFH